MEVALYFEYIGETENHHPTSQVDRLNISTAYARGYAWLNYPQAKSSHLTLTIYTWNISRSTSVVG